MSVVFNCSTSPDSPSSTSSSSSSPSPSSHPKLPLSAFSSLPLTSSLSSSSIVPINSPPRAKPTTTYLPTFEKPIQFHRNRNPNGAFSLHSHRSHSHSHYAGSDPISYFVCASCGTHLSQTDELISKAFSGRDGKAYLFQSTINTVLGKHEDRELLTGLHTVADLKCRMCEKSVGWAYIKAHENTQKYKEGKFIMERAALHKENNWDDWD